MIAFCIVDENTYQDLRDKVGSLFVVGFDGPTMPKDYEAALRRRDIGGAILFKRNIVDVAQVVTLNRSLITAGATIIGVDQEGGRVMRLGEPCLQLPPAMRLAKESPDFIREVARAQSEELRALGFTINFAPVLDVHTNEKNPVIGDRAFGTDPETVAKLALAFAAGMREGGMLSCGKHFPGHGDTDKDSHIELPIVSKSAEELEAVEMLPFKRAAEFGIDAIMSAHVKYLALDPESPATMSLPIIHGELRRKLKFQGVVVSDDLEMKALLGTPGYIGIQAILSGCDLMIVGSKLEWAIEMQKTITRECEGSEAFRLHVRKAVTRAQDMVHRTPPNPNLRRFHELVARNKKLNEKLSRLT
jgi:beta-N-acetylhexosaminidase